jgi:hypothetical protein
MLVVGLASGRRGFSNSIELQGSKACCIQPNPIFNNAVTTFSERRQLMSDLDLRYASVNAVQEGSRGRNLCGVSQSLALVVLIAFSHGILTAAYAQKAIRPSGVLLPESQAKALLQQCSRLTPKGVDGRWKVPQTTIDRLERDLHKLKSTESGMFGGGQSVSEPSTYFRQYAGITIRGKRFVYINAVRTSDPFPNWHSEPMIFCDGGKSAWGAVYDPVTGRFSQLEFNGLL